MCMHRGEKNPPICKNNPAILMGFKSILIKPFASKIARNIQKWSSQPLEAQEKVMHYLIANAKRTVFGKDHHFDRINSYEAFKGQIPIRDYEGLRPYIDQIKNGGSDILWKGRPKYFAKTSGTTSGVKYIPLTKESLPNHFGTARNALFNYFARTGNGDFFSGTKSFENERGRNVSGVLRKYNRASFSPKHRRWQNT